MRLHEFATRHVPNVEGRLFLVGVLLWGAVLTEVGLWFLVDADEARGLILGVATEVVTGREGGIPTALAGGAPPWLIFQLSATQDIGSALLVYPLFLHAIHRWHDADNYLMRRVRGIEQVAARRKAYVRRWGPLGIGLFMLIPFVVNGPLLGLVLGRLAGIPTRYVVPPVVIATVVAAAAWTYGFDAMIGFAERFSGQAAWWIAGLMVTIVVTLAGIDYLRERRGKKGEGGAKSGR